MLPNVRYGPAVAAGARRPHITRASKKLHMYEEKGAQHFPGRRVDAASRGGVDSEVAILAQPKPCLPWPSLGFGASSGSSMFGGSLLAHMALRTAQINEPTWRLTTKFILLVSLFVVVDMLWR